MNRAIFQTIRRRAAALIFMAAAASVAVGQAADQAQAGGTGGTGAASGTAGTASGGAASGDNPFDIGGFDQSLQASINSADSAKTEYLVGGSVLVEAQAFSPSSFDAYLAESSTQGKVFAKVTVPDYGSLYASFAFDHPFFQGSEGYASAAPFGPADLSTIAFSLAELHYSFDIAKTLFVRIGDQLIAWGPSKIWTPVDFVNLEHSNPFQSVDTRLGKSGVRLHLPFRSSNIFLFADLSQSVTGGVMHDLGSTTRAAARYDITLGNFEFGFSGLAGKEVQGRGGFDLSGRLFGSTLYGEAVYAPAYASYASSWSTSLGFERKLDELKRWTMSGEFYYQSTGGDYSGQNSVMESLPPLYMGAYYAYGAIEADKLGSSYLTMTLYVLSNLSDGSFTVNAREDFSFPRSVPFSLSLSYYGGGADKELTLLSGNGSLGVSLQALLQF